MRTIMLPSTTKLRVYRSMQRDPAAEFTRQVFEMRQSVDEALEREEPLTEAEVRKIVQDVFTSDPKLTYSIIDRVLSDIQRLPLKKGDDGLTPEKGVHYFTEEDKQELVEQLKDHIPPPVPGEAGKDADADAIADKVIARISKPKKGKKGKDADEDRIITAITARILPVFEALLAERDTQEESIEVSESKGLAVSDIAGLSEEIKEIKGEITKIARSKGKQGGGGDVVVAGTNVTVTRTTGGKRQISSTGGSSTVYSETPTGTIDGANKVYTVLNTITAIISLTINGEYIHPSEYSAVGTTITFVTALPLALASKSFTAIYV